MILSQHPDVVRDRVAVIVEFFWDQTPSQTQARLALRLVYWSFFCGAPCVAFLLRRLFLVLFALPGHRQSRLRHRTQRFVRKAKLQ